MVAGLSKNAVLCSSTSKPMKLGLSKKNWV